MGTLTRERERAASLFAANKSSPNRSLLLLLFDSESIRHFVAFKKQKKKAEKMISSLMIVLLALAGSQAAKLTSTGVDLEPPPRNTPNTLDWLMVLMEPRTTEISLKRKIWRFLAKSTLMAAEKSAWMSSSPKSPRSSKRF